MYTWLHYMLQPANKHIRFLTEEERNIHWAFLKAEENLGFAVQPRYEIKRMVGNQVGGLCALN